MLDPRHPQFEQIETAARLKASFLERAKEMTLVPSVRRFHLLAECQQLCTKMRQLNQEHFGSSGLIYDSISDLEWGVSQIANLGGGNILEDSFSRSIFEYGYCPFCGHELIALKYCQRCFEVLIPPLSTLELEFHTNLI